MKGYLVDVNVLLALAWPNHPFHRRALAWFDRLGKVPWATCTVTELGFIRLSSDPRFTGHSFTPSQARDVLVDLTAAVDGYERWPEPTVGALSRDVADALTRARGPRQVTDAYLVALAASKGGRVATFDGGMHAAWAADVELVA
jgi:toxin-antitoxin system PIN domain toxin